MKRMLIALGGIAGIIGIILAVIPIIQTVWESRQQDRVDATVIAIQEEQLEVMREITTLQAVDSDSNSSTATVVAERLASLQKTATALEMTQLESTITVLEQESRDVATPSATKAQIFPTPTPTRVPVRAYQTVSIQNIANATLDFEAPATGSVTLGGVEFYVSEQIFKSQASPSPHSTFPTNALIPTDVSRAYRVHLLLNSGNGFNSFQGKSIGQVKAHCGGNPILVTDLRLGRDVREWHTANNVVSSASRVVQVWSGKIVGFPDLTGYIDLLSIDLPEVCQESKLTAIEIIDTSSDTVNSLDPALNLIALTIEYYQ